VQEAVPLVGEPIVFSLRVVPVKTGMPRPVYAYLGLFAGTPAGVEADEHDTQEEAAR
jgi:hypothetical protein